MVNKDAVHFIKYTSTIPQKKAQNLFYGIRLVTSSLF